MDGIACSARDMHLRRALGTQSPYTAIPPSARLSSGCDPVVDDLVFSRSSTVQLISVFISHPVKVAVAVLLVVLFGAIALFRMPVEMTPRVEQQWLSVSTTWPGAGPEEVEREIVYEQEKQLKSIPGMKYIVGQSSNSRARVSMGFDVKTDMNEALIKVNSRLQQIKSYPETALEPALYSGTDDSAQIATFNMIPRPPSDEELAAFAEQHPELSSQIDEILGQSIPTIQLERLQRLAETHPALNALLPADLDVARQAQFVEEHILAAIGRVQGVANVRVWGGKHQEMRVIVDPAKLAVLGVPLVELRNTLRDRNSDAPAGQLNEGKRKFDVRVMGRYTSPQQIEQEVIAVIDGAPVTIGDIAEVRLAYRSQLDSAAKHFSTDCLRINVSKEPGANILDVMDDIKTVRDELNSGVLKTRGLLLYQSYDDTEYVAASISSLQFNMLLGAALTTIVLLLFLKSARSTMLVGLAIPISIIGTILCLRLLGRSLNVVSLAGMSFAIGMLVDNAVVVLENIYRHYQAGASPTQAARRGTAEVWGATLASTLTTLAVFVPILFVREEAGQLFRDIALAISCGVGLSLIVSVVVIPTAAARLLPPHDRRGGKSRLGQTPDEVTRGATNDSSGARLPDGDDLRIRQRRSLLSYLLSPLDAVAGRFGRAVVWLNRMLNRHLMLKLTNVLLFVAGAVAVAYVLMPPVEYLPNGNVNSVKGRLVPPPGYNVRQLLSLGDAYYDQIRPLIEQPTEPAATAGTSSDTTQPPATVALTDPDSPRIVDYTFGAFMGKGYFSCKSDDPLRASELVDLMKARTGALPGVEAYVNQSGLFQDGWGSSSRVIEVHILGPDLRRLVELGTEVRSRVENVLPGATAYPTPSLEMGKPELRVIPDKLRAAEAGLSATEIGFAVDAFIDGAFADKYILNGEEIDLKLSLRADTTRERKLEDVPLSSSDGQVIPLSTIARIDMASSLESIRHINRERAITINVTPPEGVALATAIEKIETQVVAPLQEGGQLDGLYRITLSGTADKLRDTWAALRLNFLIAVLITYLLMAALFESWSYPFVIMVTLPLAAVGGLVGLRIVGLFTNQLLDILTMLGFVILIGTVVNNAILIVHQALNYMRRDGMHPDDAVLKSVATRIRPIFMTTITTTFGLFPLVVVNAAGSELYRGLGSVVLGGLVFSTLFTLFLVPSLFSLMHQFRSLFANRERGISQSPVTSRQMNDKSDDTTAGISVTVS
jgi:hydrophobic/amphiphilic exporter-1 (mainly G- bacteria), HAE1 family